MLTSNFILISNQKGNIFFLILFNQFKIICPFGALLLIDFHEINLKWINLKQWFSKFARVHFSRHIFLFCTEIFLINKNVLYRFVLNPIFLKTIFFISS